MSYRVELPNFAGPMDLLLHLVKKQEVRLSEISISKILKDFLQFLKALETLDLNNIGDFLVMASTLMEIKSKEILPRETVDLKEELDPRDELIHQLLEYRRYNILTRRLEGLSKKREKLSPRGAPGVSDREIKSLAKETRERELEESLDMEDLDVWFLVQAYARLLEETDFGKTYVVEKDTRSLKAWMEDLVSRLKEAGGQRTFRDAFDPRKGKLHLIGHFMALLELMKQGRIRAKQVGTQREIYLALIPASKPKMDSPESEAQEK
jgi:segregation and condensation protein A